MKPDSKLITILMANDDPDDRLLVQEALKEIKSDEKLRHLPVVILTTSKAEEDILRSYDLGVNSFIVKPVTFDSLVELIKDLDKYWFQIVELPRFEN